MNTFYLDILNIALLCSCILMSEMLIVFNIKFEKFPKLGRY